LPNTPVGGGKSSHWPRENPRKKLNEKKTLRDVVLYISARKALAAKLGKPITCLPSKLLMQRKLKEKHNISRYFFIKSTFSIKSPPFPT
jgi:hypothetical protein